LWIDSPNPVILSLLLFRLLRHCSSRSSSIMAFQRTSSPTLAHNSRHGYGELSRRSSGSLSASLLGIGLSSLGRWRGWTPDEPLITYICHSLSSIPQAVLTMCFMSRRNSCLVSFHVHYIVKLTTCFSTLSVSVIAIFIISLAKTTRLNTHQILGWITIH
jgi:hypothetical protein